MRLNFLEYTAAALAMTGTTLMALHLFPSASVAAWCAWIGGSVLFCVWSVSRRAWGVFALNVVYIVLDLIGLARALGVL